MGWAPGDQEKVDRAKIELAHARDGLYKIVRLKQTLSNIQHSEKRQALVAEVEKLERCADECFKNIDMDLNR